MLCCDFVPMASGPTWNHLEADINPAPFILILFLQPLFYLFFNQKYMTWKIDAVVSELIADALFNFQIRQYFYFFSSYISCANGV